MPPWNNPKVMEDFAALGSRRSVMVAPQETETATASIASPTEISIISMMLIPCRSS
jgi:hypothetical protein